MNLKDESLIVTGCAGLIGSFLAARLVVTDAHMGCLTIFRTARGATESRLLAESRFVKAASKILVS
jgi:hypothetical protein